MNPLDGNYKFTHCIHRDENETMREVAGCGGCGGGKKIETGFVCQKRLWILNEQNRVHLCGTCWVGQEKIGEEIVDFKKPWEI